MKNIWTCLVIAIVFCLSFGCPVLASLGQGQGQVQGQGQGQGNEEISPSSLNGRLETFVAFIKDLHQEDLLDGEFLIAQADQTLIHLQSNAISSQAEPKFMIGSVTKQFFAVALLKALYDSTTSESKQQKLAEVKQKLHSPLSHFLPKHSSVWEGEMPAWANQVTLHHLLTHTSGIPNYTETKGYYHFVKPDKQWFESYHPPSEIVRLISDESLLFEPGSEYNYSNTGYVLIAEVIEAITLRPISDYLQEVLFKPCGLNATMNPAKGTRDDLSRISALVPQLKYDLRKKQKELYPQVHSEDISVAKGSGSIISTAEDLLKWNNCLHKDKTLLPQELYELMITDFKEEYGYGIGVENYGAGLVLGHKGSIGSFRSLLLYLPKYELSIIVLCHISYDFEKIRTEFDALVSELQKTHADEKTCREEAQRILFERYPHTRGFELIAEKVDELLLN